LHCRNKSSGLREAAKCSRPPVGCNANGPAIDFHEDVIARPGKGYEGWGHPIGGQPFDHFISGRRGVTDFLFGGHLTGQLDGVHVDEQKAVALVAAFSGGRNGNKPVSEYRGYSARNFCCDITPSGSRDLGIATTPQSGPRT